MQTLIRLNKTIATQLHSNTQHQKTQIEHKNTMPAKEIFIKGARQHNLKNIDVAIPRNQLVVVTGVSGSGKSSLIFDTLFAEGQRRYVESLSSYARQFLTRMKKPDVDYIKGISPAMAIEQKVSISNPRSTVGTSTEVYDYIKLLFARVGQTVSPVSKRIVKKFTLDDIVAFINQQTEHAALRVYTHIHLHQDRNLEDELKLLMQKGFTRLLIDQNIVKIQDYAQILEDNKDLITDINNIFLLVDRFELIKDNTELQSRIADSVQTALYEGQNECFVGIDQKETHHFSNKYELDGITFEEPTINLFSFNNPYGACKTCEGFGSVLGLDEHLIIPNTSLSVYEGAVACWKGEKMSEYQKTLITSSHHFDFPIHRPYKELEPHWRALLWSGNEYFVGLNNFFIELERENYKIQYRVMLSRFKGKQTCPDCQGSRLRKDAGYIKIIDQHTHIQHSIIDLVLMNISTLKDFFLQLTLDDKQTTVAKRVLIEINNRLSYLEKVGLGYLSLNRLSRTLSGGESQRLRLATSLGSNLTGSLYILDEPSIGLHPKDNERLIEVLKYLRNLGNTVIVVEHEEAVMKQADNLIDIGIEAGVKGGYLVFQGSYNALLASQDSLTGQYLSGKISIEIPKSRRQWSEFLHFKGVRENNLKNIDVKIPLHVLCVVTGVSGSGKTSLIKNVVAPTVSRMLEKMTINGNFDTAEGNFKSIERLELIDQNPIGRSSRSNPVTYTKAYDYIRELFIEQQISKIRGYKPSVFSFNVDGGRCDACKGEGTITVEMQFLADVTLQCDSCLGKRFKEDILEVEYKTKNISDVLNLTIDEAIEFFKDEKAIVQRLQPLQDVGMGYVGLGQNASTLSGGEAQRVKLASYLNKQNENANILFIFDEPTTGLHFHDIKKLLISFQRLVDNGNSLIVIEHNQEIIKCADWIIDIGPEGGDKLGGNIVFEGTPEQIIHCKESYTGRYLKEKMQDL